MCDRWGEGLAHERFKGRHFEGVVVLWAVRWYCRYPISYRDLETMMTERGGLRHFFSLLNRGEQTHEELVEGLADAFMESARDISKPRDQRLRAAETAAILAPIR